MPPHTYLFRIAMTALPAKVLIAGTRPEDDRALMVALAKGDRAALGVLYDRYAGLLLALAQRLVGQQREAEDLVHDVFLEAWRLARGYDPDRGSPRAWLVTRLRSRGLDRLRGGLRYAWEPAAEELLEAPDDPSSNLDRQRVHSALSQLSAEQRQVLILGYFEGLSANDIADRLAVPVGTVKSRAARGMAQLRRGLLGQGALP